MSYGYNRKAELFLAEQKMEVCDDRVPFEKLLELIALAMARGHYGDKVTYVDRDGTARNQNGRHFDGLGQGADVSRY